MKQPKDRNGSVLDPNSEYYRQDPYTLEYFMASRTDQKFFSNHEKDLYNNRIKKNNRIAEQVKEEQSKTFDAEQVRKGKCEFAIAQLYLLDIGPVEKEFHIAQIFSLGIDLNAYDGIYRVPGTPNNFYITFGEFQIALWSTDKLIILKTTN